MQLSARNQLRGTILSIRTDGLLAEITIDIGTGQMLVSVITRASAEALSLRQGDQVTAVIKATEVIVGK